MKIRTAGRMALAVSALSACAALAPVSAASAHVLRHAPKHKLTGSTSTNWSGYTIDGTNATSVTGSWTVQPATCSGRENSWSSPWVGIDGDTSSTVEQTGTDTDCNGGTPYYYAWWEMYPAPTQVIGHAVNAGDSITASVTYGSGGFTMALVDHTTPWNFSITQASTKAPRSSVEWIVEGPSTGSLTNFGTLNFSGDSATINGKSGSPASLGASALTMVTKKGATRALPGALDKSGGFADTWYRS